jgi:hypothetical protein
MTSAVGRDREVGVMTTRMCRNEYTVLLVSIACFGFTGIAAGEPLVLDEHELFFELNDTDGDLGIHASIDGGPYTELEIEDPRGREILSLEASGRLARQGMTQFFLESAEPSFDELSPEDFFRRFPEGFYEIEVERGRKEFETMVYLSHVMAAPADGILVSGIPAAEDCDDPNLPIATEPVLIQWDPVEESHPEIGESGDVEIVRYQFFVEQDDIKLSVDLPPDVTEFVVPQSITGGGGVFKYEIIARTADLNNTAVESCFVIQ